MRRGLTASGGSASRRSSARSATFLILTRFDFPSLAVRGYIDIPFMATIVWAGALEVARPRRGLVVFLLLAAAGLMRPEAWILSGLYFLWMSWHASWPDRIRYALLTGIAPLGWMATDLIVTGDPLFSLTSTKDLAAELQRSKSGSGVLSALPSDLRITVKTPVFVVGLVGIAIAIWRYPVRSLIPFVLFCAGTFTFLATGLAGLSVIVRYLLVPGVMMSLFAGLALGGFTTLPQGSRGRRLWAPGPASRSCSDSSGRRFTRRASSASTTSSSSAASPGAASTRCSTSPPSGRACGADRSPFRPIG